MLDKRLINKNTPENINEDLVLVEVEYLGFDSSVKIGQMVVDRLVEKDIEEFFKKAFQIKFPIEKVVLPSEYDFDDDLIMADNNSSGFNYRFIAGSKRVSKHGLGLAFDVNPKQNPYIRYTESGEIITSPKGAQWDMNIPGTLYLEHPLVVMMKSKGWTWGGEWTPDSGRVDYQHFEK